MPNLPAESRFTLTGGPEPDLRREFAEAMRQGLGSTPKVLPCRYLYDARGSELFDEICEQPEYYPTRTEAGILCRMSEDLIAGFQSEPHLVELGSGSAEKTRTVVEALMARFGRARFLPIDVSRTAIEFSADAMLADYPNLAIHGHACGYLEGLRQLEREAGAPQLILWLGSSIGNFHRPEAIEFLAAVGESMQPADRLLVGFDRRKDPKRLEAAYDDAAGVTAEFILNLLARMNRELGADFDLERFAYRSNYDSEVGRVEMWVESLVAQHVDLAGMGWGVDFAAGERIHMENSYKYSPEEITGLAEKAGLQKLQTWTDPDDLFSEVLFAAR
jgi:L-histidine Nalpha-methyltransferase